MGIGRVFSSSFTASAVSIFADLNMGMSLAPASIGQVGSASEKFYLLAIAEIRGARDKHIFYRPKYGVMNIFLPLAGARNFFFSLGSSKNQSGGRDYSRPVRYLDIFNGKINFHFSLPF
jgi:hypothetical protein